MSTRDWAGTVFVACLIAVIALYFRANVALVVFIFIGVLALAWAILDPWLKRHVLARLRSLPKAARQTVRGAPHKAVTTTVPIQPFLLMSADAEALLSKLLGAYHSVPKDKRQSFQIVPLFSATLIPGPPSQYLLKHPGLPGGEMLASSEDIALLAHFGFVRLEAGYFSKDTPVAVTITVAALAR